MTSFDRLCVDQALAQVVRRYCQHRFKLAFSGGLDSTVLLSGLAAQRQQHDFELIALHVNHGWTDSAVGWEAHGRAFCQSLGVPFVSVHFGDQRTVTLNREEVARRRRLRWFCSQLEQGDILLTAHHRDDQAETILYRLLRGAGVRGLGAMAVETRLGKARVVRPLIDLSRAEIAAYAAARGLSFIEDPSNQDTGLDRNYIRHTVMPLLEQRWPGATTTLARAAGHLRQAQSLLAEVGSEDLARCGRPAVGNVFKVLGSLGIPQLRDLSKARQANLLRHWIMGADLLLPSKAALEELLRQLPMTGPDTAAALCWGAAEIRQYRDLLYLLPPQVLQASPIGRSWDPSEDALVPETRVRVHARTRMGQGLKLSMLEGKALELRWVRGQATIRPGPGRSRRSVKNLLQEAAVPPWERRRLPLVYHHGQLVCVPGVAIAAELWTGSDEPGLEILVTDLAC